MKSASSQSGQKRSAELQTDNATHHEKESVIGPLGDGIVCVDNDWRYTYLNDAALATHPLGREETLGKVIWDIHPGMKGTVFWDKYHEAMETKKIVEIESHYGPMRTWFFVKVYPSPSGLTILYMDITVRKRAEEEVIQTKMSQEAILENTSDLIWSINTEYCLLFCNSQFRNFIKTNTQKEIQFGDDIRAFIPRDYPELTALCDRGLSGEKFSVQLTKVKAGNEMVEDYFFNPIVNEKGILLGVSVFVRDITDRRKAEKKIKESESKYQSLVAELSDAIFITDENGNYTDVNPSACRLLGYTRSELISMNARDILYAAEKIRFLPQRYEQLRAGGSHISENRLKRKDGSPVDVEVNSRMSTDGHFIGIVRDITERKRVTEALDKRERRFRAMVENNNDIIALLDKSFRPLYNSPSAERITGYSLEESMDRTSIGEVHFEDKPKLEVLLKQVFSTPAVPLPLEFRIQHKNGHYIWLEGSITNLFHDPNVNALVLNLRDITARKEAEKNVAASEMRFRALIENITDGIVLNDAQSNLLYQSASVERILGYSWDERTGKAVSSYVHPDYLEEFAALYRKLNANPGTPFPFQYRFRHKKGHYIWLEGVVTNLTEEPSVKGFVANYRDITDRKEAEEKLKAERTLLRTLIDNLPDYIYVKDSEFRYLVNNKSQLELMGITTKEEAVGRTAADIFGDTYDRSYHKEDEQVFKTGIAVMHREEMIIDNSGTPKFLLSTKVPLRDEHQAIVGLVGISRDITKQKQIEQELRDSNYFLESAQRAGKIGYWISDIRSGELTWSDETCKIFGISPDEFDRRIETFYKIIHPDDVKALVQAATASIEIGVPYALDHRITLQDGSLKWVHEQGEVILEETGLPTKLLGIVQDITERKNAEQEILLLNVDLEERVRVRTAQLQAANKEMEAFTYSVSHDLRSPLRIIDGYAQILLEDHTEKLDETGQKTLEVIMTNAKKMGQLIDDLLDFSRIGRTEIRKVTVSMDEMVREVVHDVRLTGVKMPDLKIAPLATALCDPNLIKNVWMNLLLNAVKYSGSKASPLVEIGETVQHGKVTYFVKDNGAGFDMQYYHKLFGVFQRLHSHHEFTGTGVGLAIVHRIVIRHGGSVWADAKVNEGATFFFSLE